MFIHAARGGFSAQQRRDYNGQRNQGGKEQEVEVTLDNDL